LLRPAHPRLRLKRPLLRSEAVTGTEEKKNLYPIMRVFSLIIAEILWRVKLEMRRGCKKINQDILETFNDRVE
jgi:hypothetical protein